MPNVTLSIDPELALRSAAMRGVGIWLTEEPVDTPENLAKPEEEQKTEWILRLEPKGGEPVTFKADNKQDVIDRAALSAAFSPESFDAKISEVLGTEDRTRFERFIYCRNLILQAVRERGFGQSLTQTAELDREVLSCLRRIWEAFLALQWLMGKGSLTDHWDADRQRACGNQKETANGASGPDASGHGQGN